MCNDHWWSGVLLLVHGTYCLAVSEHPLDLAVAHYVGEEGMGWAAIGERQRQADFKEDTEVFT